MGEIAAKVLPDEGIKQLLGQVVKAALQRDTLSGELMHRCIDEQRTPFTRADLHKLDPKLVTQLRQMMRAAPEVQHLQPGQSLLWDTRGVWSDVNDAPDIKGGAKNQAHDLRRILGNVSVTRDMRGTITVEDYFDVKDPRAYLAKNDPGRWQGEETPTNLLRALLDAHKQGKDYLRNLYIGRMFCPEPANNNRGEKSIPISISYTQGEVLIPVATPVVATVQQSKRR